MIRCDEGCFIIINRKQAISCLKFDDFLLNEYLERGMRYGYLCNK